MNYLEEERIFKQESKLEKLWGDPIVLIYSDIIKVIPQKELRSHYVPFSYKGKKVIIDNF